MLYDESIIGAVASVLRSQFPLDLPPLVVDPVFVSTSGHQLLAANAVEALKTHLFPLTTVLTPNLIEAKILSGAHTDIKDVDGMKTAARKLAGLGAKSVLVKGGHLPCDGPVIDILYESDRNEFTVFENECVLRGSQLNGESYLFIEFSCLQTDQDIVYPWNGMYPLGRDLFIPVKGAFGYLSGAWPCRGI
jgi:hydroxymethylpyrimidine kinase/phosphomethylpyrimidine kinase